MASMMSSRKNRSATGIDNPVNDDGFYVHRRFHANRRAGAASSKRGWRRAIRTVEKRAYTKEIQEA